MAKNFYFGKQADIVAGSANFSTLISSGAVSFGLTTGQATSFAALNTALQSAYNTAISPNTRTKTAVEANKIAIENMRRTAVLFAKIITATPTVSDAQLVSLGLLPRIPPAPRPIPLIPPVLTITNVLNRLVTIKVRPGGNDSRSKPQGCVGAQIFTYAGAAPPSDPRAYHYEGLATRGSAQILFPDSIVSGSTVWIAAGWVTQRGYACTACSPQPVTIQGGAVLPQAA